MALRGACSKLTALAAATVIAIGCGGDDDGGGGEDDSPGATVENF
jgi:hypothetical protein